MRSRAHIAGLWLWFVALTWVRFPHLLHHADLYGEEAVYFLIGRARPAWQTLFAVRFGYLSLTANVVGEVVSLFPLAYAPLAMRLIAVAIGPAVVVAVVIGLRSSVTRTAIAIAIVVMTPLMIAEWATAIHAQFWLVVALTLCLPMAFDSGWRRWSVRVLAAFTVLSAALGAVLFVFFGWRAWRQRDRDAAVLSGILLVGGVIQFVLGAGRRSVWTFGRFLAALLQQDVFEGLFGPWADPIGIWLGDMTLGWPVMVMIVAALAAAVGLALWLVPTSYRLAVFAAVVLGSLSIWYALAPWFMFRFYLGERYALAGTMPIVILIVLGAEVRSWARTALVVAISMSAISSGYGVGREYDSLIADRPDYWRESLAVDDGQVRANYFCRYTLGPPRERAMVASTSITPVDGGFRVELDELAPFLDDPNNNVYLTSNGWAPRFDQSWADATWIGYGSFSFGGPEYVCYTGPTDRSPSGLQHDGSAVIVPLDAIESAFQQPLRPGGVPGFEILIGPTYEQAIIRQQTEIITAKHYRDDGVLGETDDD